MIHHIQLLRNIGQFDNVNPPEETTFTPFSLIYGENGAGKTTIAAILRSLAVNTPLLITERQRLGSQQPPHVVINHADGRQSVFQNGAWTNCLSNIAIFDDAFVSDNICSGIEVQSAQRQGMHGLILGEQGVTLNNALQEHIANIERHNLNLRNLSAAIPANARGPYEVDEFCDLVADEQIDQKIEEVERRLAAARSSDAIRQRSIFLPISLPDFNIENINAILGQGLPELDAAAMEHIRVHISKLGESGEAWVAEGMPRISSVSADLETEICPFCAQELPGIQLIDHYRAYFSQAYNNLKSSIMDTGISVRDTHGGEIVAAFERSIRAAIETRDFWKEFAELAEISIDTAAIARSWCTAREAVLEILRAKAASPLRILALSTDARRAIDDFREHIREVNGLSESLVAVNDQLARIKEQVGADNVVVLSSDLERLRAQRARFDHAVVPHCTAYLTERQAKATTEDLRTQARTALDQYRQQIFPAYENTINEYLNRFAATFRIFQVRSSNTRSGSLASYQIVINNHNVNASANSGPSFRNTLSAGDRNTLALAFFFASLELDPELENKIVIIDDPMTSLDEHRILCTREQIVAMSARVQQVIVLSHSKPFLCGLWEQVDRNASTALRINRVGQGTELAVWDVRNDSVSEHDKRHELVRQYINVADPTKEREVAAALRPILEAFMRVAYPGYFPAGSLLGQFIAGCENRLGTDSETLPREDVDELRSLKDYANQFHHDTNPAWQTAHINGLQLTNFAQRTLLFATRR